MSTKNYTNEEKNAMASLRQKFLQEPKEALECHYCGCKDKYKADGKQGYANYTLDHIVSHNEGGKCEEDNMVISCWECNNYKDTLSYNYFFNRMEKVREAFKKYYSAEIDNPKFFRDSMLMRISGRTESPKQGKQKRYR